MKLLTPAFALLIGLGSLQTASAGSPPILVETMTGINGLVNIEEWDLNGSLGPFGSTGSYLVDVLDPELNVWAFAVSTSSPNIPYQNFAIPGWDARYFSSSNWESQTGLNFTSLFGSDDVGVNIYGVAAEDGGPLPSLEAAVVPMLLNDTNDSNFATENGQDADFYFGGLPASQFVAFDQNFQIIDRSLAEAIPTPTALFLMAGGLLGLALRRR